MKATEQRIVSDALEELIRERAKPSRSTADFDAVGEHLDRILQRNGLAIVPVEDASDDDDKSDKLRAATWRDAYNEAIGELENLRADAEPALTATGDTIELAVDADDVIDRLKELKDKVDD